MESLENFENNLPQFNPIRVQSNISKSKEIFGQIFKIYFEHRESLTTMTQ